MRSLLTYILLIAVLLPSISPWGTIAYYHLNQDYIARNLCVNRDKPQLHCNGQCYLARRLKAEQDRQDKETSERVQQTAPLQLFCEEQLTFNFGKPTTFIPTPNFAYLTGSYATPARWLLKPPCQFLAV
ncbi:hypothetical protein [Spirosoma sp.]|uniref:hypothetical protein n=1 Tax=Spirosoma sp. TaxID=1899569 RepID=UPI0026267A52|nr:hypothetical protein [Spirosoma sp.]MCX6215611.1 hypothetical protein [Spirosoma sp.]